MQADVDATELADQWIAGLSGEDRFRWLALADARRDLALSRLRALLLVTEGGAKPSVAAAGENLDLGRFYQLLRAWKAPAGRSLATLGVRAKASSERATRLDEEGAKAKDLAIGLMRRALDTGTPNGTNELLDKIQEEVGDSVSRISLLRWWKAERRTRPVGLLGSLLALDYCALDLRRSDGRLHAASFVVDRGTRTILGAALAPSNEGDEPHINAAADALRRLPQLEMSRLTGTSRFSSVSVAAKDWNGLKSLHFQARLLLPKSVVRYVRDEALFGRSVVAAAGERWATTRLRQGAAAGHDVLDDSDGTPVFSTEDAEQVLIAGLEAHQDVVRDRLARLPPVCPGQPAEKRIEALLARVAVDADV